MSTNYINKVIFCDSFQNISQDYKTELNQICFLTNYKHFHDNMLFLKHTDLSFYIFNDFTIY